MTTKDEIILSHCNVCGADKKHRIVAKTRKYGSEDTGNCYTVEWHTDSFLLECCGCGEASLRQKFWHSEIDPPDLEDSFYPPRVSRKLPSWINDLPDGIASLLKEIYSTLHDGNLRLAMMGARTVLDTYMTDKVGDIGGFDQKLKALTEQGYLADKNKEVLAAALDVGHAASHRGHEPISLEASHVMDIVENLIQADILALVAGDLRKSTPGRRQKKQ